MAIDSTNGKGSSAAYRPRAFVLINVEIGDDEKALRDLKNIKNVEAHAIYAIYDIMAEVKASSYDEAKGTIQKIRAISYVKSTMTLTTVD